MPEGQGACWIIRGVVRKVSKNCSSRSWGARSRLRGGLSRKLPPSVVAGQGCGGWRDWLL